MKLCYLCIFFFFLLFRVFIFWIPLQCFPPYLWIPTNCKNLIFFVCSISFFSLFPFLPFFFFFPPSSLTPYSSSFLSFFRSQVLKELDLSLRPFFFFPLFSFLTLVPPTFLFSHVFEPQPAGNFFSFFFPLVVGFFFFSCFRSPSNFFVSFFFLFPF